MGVKDILDLSFEFSSKIGTRQLPKLSGDYESNVKGMYIVGDLADAPVIKIALVQGYDVANKLIDREFGGSPPSGGTYDCDVAVLGAGPATKQSTNLVQYSIRTLPAASEEATLKRTSSRLLRKVSGVVVFGELR